MSNSDFDVVIVGGGPAGLSAALVLGRCRRRVLICDSGNPRNAASQGLHAFITRDGIKPAEFLAIAREQLKPYTTVELRNCKVIGAKRAGKMFELTAPEERTFTARKLLLATGVIDELPEVPGLKELYGRSVFHCPYCDGWEMKDQPLAVYGNGENGAGLAKELLLWSRDVVLCTDAGEPPDEDTMKELSRLEIRIRTEKISGLEGAEGVLKQIVFKTGDPLPRRGLFFSTGQHQHADLAKQLGCVFSEEGCVDTGDYEATNVHGLYVAGDASRLVQMVIVAASEGAQAAVAINKELMKEDLAADHSNSE